MAHLLWLLLRELLAFVQKLRSVERTPDMPRLRRCSTSVACPGNEEPLRSFVRPLASRLVTTRLLARAAFCLIAAIVLHRILGEDGDSLCVEAPDMRPSSYRRCWRGLCDPPRFHRELRTIIERLELGQVHLLSYLKFLFE